MADSLERSLLWVGCPAGPGKSWKGLDPEEPWPGAWACRRRMLKAAPDSGSRSQQRSVTTAGLGLDVLSARVTQRLSLSVRPFLLQTGQIQPLTAGVFGESPGPGVRLTPLPLCMLFTLRSWHVDKKKEKRGKKQVFYPRWRKRQKIWNWQRRGSKHFSRSSTTLWGCQNPPGSVQPSRPRGQARHVHKTKWAFTQPCSKCWGLITVFMNV